MKLLMVGLGGIGQRHVRNLRTLLGNDVEILAYRVRRFSHVLTDTLQLEAGVDLEQKYNVTVFTEFDEALRQKPDATLICNPSSLHIPFALKAVEAGSHLFIEKPLSHSYEDVDRLVATVESTKRIALVGYQLRFHPCLIHVATLLRQKAVGRVIAVRAEVGEFLPGWHTYEDYRTMYASRKELGGGVILSQIHEMDYLYWFFGLPRKVFSLGGHLSQLDVDVEDVASTLMEFQIDGQAVPVHLHQDYVQRPPSRTCHILGDSGKIFLDLRAACVDVYDATGNLTETFNADDFPRNQLFLDEMKHFLACIDGRENPVVTLRDGAQSLRMALAVKESLEKGCTLELDGGANATAF